MQLSLNTRLITAERKIPAIPTNYALWYTYVENQDSEFHEEIERAIEEGRPFSNIYTKELYRKHVADKEELTAWQLRQSVEAMVTELSQTVLDTQNNTEGFKTSMDTNLRHLDKVEKEGWSMGEVMKLVRSMVKEAQLIRNSTLDFATALKAAAKRLQEKCKPNAILMHGATLAEAIHQAENIRLSLEKISVIDRRTNRHITGVTASFGVAAMQPGMRRSDLLEAADRQLYQAKRLGRNRVMPMSS